MFSVTAHLQGLRIRLAIEVYEVVPQKVWAKNKINKCWELESISNFTAMTSALLFLVPEKGKFK